jgi:hypothetical protein
VIISPDVKYQVFRPMIGPFFPNHPALGLVDTIPPHAEVSDRFTSVSRQVLLPGFAVADLVAMSEAVTVGVDAAFLAGVHEGGASAVGLYSGNGGTAVHAVRPVQAGFLCTWRIGPRNSREIHWSLPLNNEYN